MFKLKKLALSCSIAVSLMTFSTGSNALICAVDIAAVPALVTATSSSTSIATMALIDAFYMTIVKPTIDGAAATIQAEIAKQGTIKNASSGILADTQVIQDYKNKVADVKDSLDTPSIQKTCSNMASAGAQKQANEFARMKSAAGAVKSVTRTANTVSAEKSSIESYDLAMNKYCTKSDVATGQCKTKQVSTDLAGADMQATTLYGSIGSAKPSDTYSHPEQEAAADEFIRRVTAPNPPEMLPKTCLTPQCKSFEDSRRNYLAVSSLTSNSFHEVKSMHLPQKDLGILTGTSAITGKKDISMLEAIYAYVNQKFSPEAIKTNAVATKPEIILRDIAQTQSFKLWLDYNSLRQLERIESLLAVQVSIEADQYMKPKLDAQRESAIRSTVKVGR